eukprot:jgi/Psemu1/48549/gm1.48549_g
MASYGQPDWVNSGNNNAPVVSDANVDPSVMAPSGGAGGGGSKGRSNCALGLMSLLNMGLAAMMTALGVLTIIEVHRTGINDLSEPFLAFYMILFAVLLFLYELMWWSPMKKLNKDMRKNFGFLYGLRGKGLYLIFVAFLCFGLGKDAKVAVLNYCTGVSFLAGGLLHMFVIFFRPQTAMEYQAPTAGLGDDDNASAPDNVV